MSPEMTNLETTTSETSRIRASPLGGFRAVLPGGALASTHGVSSILASTVTGTATATVQPHTSGLPPRFDEDVNISLVKVVVLGAPGVGKTSIVKRFVSNEFPTDHKSTNKKAEFFPSLVLNDSLFELKITDLPVIPQFPPDSIVEWTDYRFFGLRNASAYLLVYDVSVPSTFQFVKNLRDQMYEARDMTNIPVIVVGNKMDLIANRESGRDRKDIVSLVKKTWRSSHVECSAKFNWNVVTVFKELAITLDMIANGQVIGNHNSVRKRRCLMF